MMKSLLSGCAVLALLLPVSARACPPGGPGGHPMMEKIDTDKDGAVSATEGEAAALEHFKAMDGNKDGSLSADEFEKAPRPDGMKKGGASPEGENMRPERLGQMKEKRFGKMDTDGDGTVTQAEFLAGAQKRHEWMDSDKDGKISKDEMDARREKMREKWQDRKQGGGGMGDDPMRPDNAPARSLNE